MSLSGDAVFPFLDTETILRSRYRIYNVTGVVRSNGVTVFSFVGPQNRSVEWTVLYGGGVLTPFTPYTDQYGRASARYEAGGWEGRVVIGVQYGS
jgi:hypothetical protein